MAINFTNFFTKFGHAVYSAKDLLQSLGPDQDTVIQSFINDFDSATLDSKASIENVVSSLRTMQSQGRSMLSGIVLSPMRRLVIEEVKADTGKSYSFADALEELLDQLDASGNTVESSTVSTAVTYGGGNTGTGELFVSDKLDNGQVNQLLYDEDIVFTCTNVTSDGGATLTGRGDESYGMLHPEYPGGSGSLYGLSPTPLSATNLLTNSDFLAADSLATTQPANWLAYDADATGSLTNVSTQDIAISGTPTGGYYNLVFYEAGGTKQLITENISYSATAGSVQASIRKLPGYDQVTVTSTGSTPNYTHTITLTGVPQVYTPTSRSFMTGGTPLITVSAIITDGEFLTGSRSLEIAGNGSEQTDYYQKVELNKNSTYFAHAMVKATAAVTTGTLSLSLLDSPGGTVLQDAAGSNNTFSVTLSSIGTTNWYHLGGFFRTNDNLPSSIYLRLNCATAIDAAGKIMVDSVILKNASRLYPAGPCYELMEGETQFALNDTITFAVNNNYSGEIQQWFQRFYGLRSRGRQLPHSGSPTYADTLITNS
mgnify:FL=1|jgi:hypothetical protein|tara:strand:- start:239 stop:1864 length:1626 start_codon:yes stop_codon:yes gene_type:complete